jgi:hypothetical protein
MKTCAVCQESFHDDSLNFCLNCGATLPQAGDNPPPTIMMNTARETNPNFAEQATRQNQPNFTDQPNFGAGAPMQNWQNPAQMQNQPFGAPLAIHGVNQTLPTISLVLGILGLLLLCCWGGLPLGTAAVITGYLGMNNANSDPQRYGGKGLAIGGLVLGAISIVGGLLLFLLAIAGNL